MWNLSAWEEDGQIVTGHVRNGPLIKMRCRFQGRTHAEGSSSLLGEPDIDEGVAEPLSDI